MKTIAEGYISFKNEDEYEEAKNYLINNGFISDGFWLSDSGSVIFTIKTFNDEGLSLNLPGAFVGCLDRILSYFENEYSVRKHFVLIKIGLDEIFISDCRMNRDSLEYSCIKIGDSNCNYSLVNHVFSELGMPILKGSIADKLNKKFERLDQARRDELRIVTISKLVSIGCKFPDTILEKFSNKENTYIGGMK